MQDANRSLSVGRFLTVDAAQDFIETEIAAIAPNATVVVQVIDGVIDTSVTIPASDLTATGMLDAFSSLTLVVAATHMSEA